MPEQLAKRYPNQTLIMIPFRAAGARGGEGWIEFASWRGELAGSGDEAV